MRLRAVQNNITQLGFVAGGTKGLIAALAAVIGGQLVIAVLKYSGVLDKEKDSLEALNDASKEQESRLQRLSQLYDSLGRSIRDAGLDEVGRTAAARARELEELKRAEEESRIARAASVDPIVTKIRGEIKSLQREAEEGKTNADRINAQSDLRKAEQDLALFTRLAGERKSSQETVAGTIEAAGIAAINTAFDSQRRSLDLLALDPDFDADQAEIMEAQIERRRGLEIEAFKQAGQELDLSSVQSQADALEASIDETRRRLRESRRANIIADPQVIREYEEQLRLLTAEQAAFENRLRDILPGAAFVRFVEASFAVADTLDRARENIDQSGIGRSLIGDEITAVSKRREELRTQADQARAEGSTILLDILTKQISALGEYTLRLESASAATRIFSDAVKRFADDLNQTVAQEARGRAVSARRRANAADDPFLDFQRQEAEEEARRAERRSRANQEQNDLLRIDFDIQARFGNLGPEIQALVDERERLQARINSGELDPLDANFANRDLRRIDAKLNQRFEDSPQAIAAANTADRADFDAARFAQLQESQLRGRDLMVTDGERAAREMIQVLEDITNAARARVTAGEDFGTVFDEVDAARARVRDDARRSIAPALFALQDQVANAVLQGPSRAALNAADVTTTQGTAELNRLLRGDDPARDQSLLELQKQTAELEKLNQNLGAAGVAD
jgi:hypothetical protein